MPPQAKEHQESPGARRGKEGMWPCWHLDFRFVASRTLRKYISVVEAAPSAVHCYGSPSRLGQLVLLFLQLLPITGILCLRSTRHYSKGITYIDPFNSNIHPIKWALSLAPFYRQNYGRTKVSNLLTWTETWGSRFGSRLSSSRAFNIYTPLSIKTKVQLATWFRTQKLDSVLHFSCGLMVSPPRPVTAYLQGILFPTNQVH